jgi:hypothetical protein
MRDWGAEGDFTPATDYIYVRSVHDETQSATATITGSTAEGTTAPCRVICCVGDTTGTSPGALATGAQVNTDQTTASIWFNESLYVYGVDFLSNNDISVGSSVVDHDISLDTCRLELIGTSSADNLNFGPDTTALGTRLTFKDLTVDFADAGQGIVLRAAMTQWVGGSVGFDISQLIEDQSNAGYHFISIIGVDCSLLASSQLIDAGAQLDGWGKVVFSRCLLASGATIVNGTIDVPGFRVESYHCQIGTDSDPAYQMEIQDARGKIITDTARYRTGGAKDSERTNPISWDFDTTAGSVRGYPGHALESPPITAWTDGDAATSHTYRIYFASDATIQNDELWMELEGPNDAATNSMAVFQTTRVAPLTSAANHTTDGSSSWTGTGVGTKQYMEVSYTPDKPGPVTVRIFMAKASDNIYVDPKIVIDP